MSYPQAASRVSAKTLPRMGICDLKGSLARGISSSAASDSNTLGATPPRRVYPLGAKPNGSRANTRRTIGSKNSSGSDS